ncbi:MAG: divalent metal cation transporter [Patescibacteria group bacterium]|nr:divalent metal cation transporter [Patescibacteria group bacterium]
MLVKKINKFFKELGPGIITGAADDDPSGIATYSQTGARFGYGQLWLSLFTLPLMTAVQEACARIGLITGRGIVAVIKEFYAEKIALAAVFLILLANTINIGADIGAMAAALRLILPLNFAAATLVFTALILVLEIFTSYKVYARILKWLALFLLAYPITVFLVREPWPLILRATFIPHLEFSFAFLFIITGVVGTTISPYLFFWEADEEVEEEREKHLLRNRSGQPPKVNWHRVKTMRVDNAVGMVASNLVTWCIIVTAATVLNANGVTNITTSAQAAQALEPLVRTFPHSGFLAKLIFASGIIGLGLLAVPVLSGSASYAVAEALNWKASLGYKLKRAHGFYGVITIATLVGLLINFVGVDPIQALLITAVINGIVAVPLIFLIAKIAGSAKIMGEYKSGNLSNFFVWLTFVFMTLAVLSMLLSLFGRYL